MQYRYLFLSILLHAILITVLFFNFEYETVKPANILSSVKVKVEEHPVSNKTDIDDELKAAMFSESELSQEIEKINAIEREKIEKEQRALNNLRKEQKTSRLKREKEEKRLKDLKDSYKKQNQKNKKINNELSEQQKKIAALKKEAQNLKLEQDKLKAEKKKIQDEALALKKEKDKIENLERERIAKEEARVNTEVGKYAALIKNKVGQNWATTAANAQDLASIMAITTSDAGEILDVKLIKSSGNTTFDRAAELAVLKSSPLPMPADGKVREKFKSFNFTFKPDS